MSGNARPLATAGASCTASARANRWRPAHHLTAEEHAAVLGVVLLDALEHTRSEVAKQALDRPRRRVAQRADGVALDLARQLVESAHMSASGTARPTAD